MDTENETKVIETKKSGKGTLVALIISIIIIIALAGYICYDKVLLSNSETEKTSKSTANKKTIVETDKEDDNDADETPVEKDNSNDNSQNSSSTSASKCTGTYYGEVSGSFNNGLSYEYRHTYTLNADGTFELNINNASGTRGVYVITGNTISLIGAKHTTGPITEDPQYSTADYVIANDCSYILVDAGEGVTFKANKR